MSLVTSSPITFAISIEASGHELEIVENCQHCRPGVGVGGIWLVDVVDCRFAGRRISCVLIQMLLSASADRVSSLLMGSEPDAGIFANC
ncbi:MAG: hypothetical protein WCF26_19950 [Candidatus Sulfotelmatobacter sp.]